MPKSKQIGCGVAFLLLYKRETPRSDGVMEYISETHYSNAPSLHFPIP